MSSSEPRRARLPAAATAGRFVAVMLAFLVASCGFHLRGNVTYSFSTLYINSPPNMPFAADMRRALSGGGTQLVEKAADAQVILDLPSVVDDKQVLSLSGGGRAREYLLTKRVNFALHDANGKDWLPGGEIVIRRSFTFNESEVLAREAEETKLLREMQADAVQQIMRRLQAAKKPA
jgi:LPS-assembly lipoprotein